MGKFELNKKIAISRGNGFKFNQINKLTMKIYSNLSNINIHYHLRVGASPLHRQFFAMTVEILFILHFANGIHIRIQIYLR